MENWGIQAVIMRPTEYDEQLHHHHGEFGTIDIKKEYDQALLFCFPHLSDHHHHHDHDHDHATMEKEVVGDDLDQLFKPFYRVNFGTQSEFSPTTATATIDGLQTIHHHDSDQELQQDQEQNVKKFRGSSSNISQHAPKLKKRKNQQKRVVVQVTADGLSSDPWAWRKYGQKPIKASIYPRSYYRCSSLKGCMARRQVEQSCTDSSIYILTYTADHNHPQPTRRNSLAGINRNRFKATPKCPTNSDGKTVAMLKDSPSLSPTTPSVSSIDDEVLQESNIKQETMSYNKVNYQGQAMMAGVNDDDYTVFSDDFFDGLEDLGGYKMESSSYNTSNKQFPRVFS